MSLESEIVALIKGLDVDHVYPDVAPPNIESNETLMFVVFAQVGGAPTNTLCGNSNGQNARIQFNVWGPRRDAVNTLMRRIESTLTEPPPTGLRAVSLGSLVAEYNAPRKAYGARQDLSFWYYT